MLGVDASAYLALMEAHPPIEATELESAEPKLAPLVLATMASQALLVTLSPTTVAVGRDLGASVGAVWQQARSVAASVAIVASLAILRRIDARGVPRLLGVGTRWRSSPARPSASPRRWLCSWPRTCWSGSPLACLLSAGFAGVATFAGAQAVGGRLRRRAAAGPDRGPPGGGVGDRMAVVAGRGGCPGGDRGGGSAPRPGRCLRAEPARRARTVDVAARAIRATVARRRGDRLRRLDRTADLRRRVLHRAARRAGGRCRLAAGDGLLPTSPRRLAAGCW